MRKYADHKGKEFKKLVEDVETYLSLHESKGIEFSIENFKKLGAEILEEKPSIVGNDYVYRKIRRPKKALSLDVIEELTELSKHRILEIEIVLSITFNKDKK